MRSTFVRTLVVVLIAGMTVACATRFSSDKIRREITTQRGQDPLSVFEFDLGKFTTLLLKKVMTTEDGKIPFSGVRELQVAVFEAPSDDGPVIDVTRIRVRGWEQVLRMHDPNRSAMVLIRPSGEMVGDLVIVGAGPRKVVYGRLRGSLDPNLPKALGDVAREGGPDEVRRMLIGLAETGDSP